MTDAKKKGGWFDERHEVVGWLLLISGLVYAVACLVIAYRNDADLAPLMSNWTALGICILGVWLVVGRQYFDGLSLRAGGLALGVDTDEETDGSDN